MGKRVRGKDYRGRSKKTRGGERAAAQPSKEDGFGDWVYENASFAAYYQAQGVVPAGEWDAFMKALATPLPTSFRVNSSCVFADRWAVRFVSVLKFANH